MQTLLRSMLLISCVSMGFTLATADEPAGLTERVPWTTSRINGSPDPPAPYSVVRVFTGLEFFEPLATGVLPDTNRLLIVERRGRIYSFENDPSTSEAELLLDLETTTYGVAAHPQFAQNGFLYVTYLPDPAATTPNGSRLARFTVDRQTLRADRDSEQIVLEWPSGGHNGGCLRFGPDGMLYLATGDGSGIADERQTGQDVSDLLASILRIDVDRAENDQGYAIPPDNPFRSLAGARPEIWAYGVRQIWKFSFDRQTGALWAGEVGQDLWESVHLIERGGNYGWSVNEGLHPFRPERTPGPTPIKPPIVEHPHADFRSLTGGFVYRGSRLPELEGAYIYGDYDTGKIAALRYDGRQVTWQQELADTQLRIVAFGQDPQGELYIVGYMSGGLYRLVPAPETPLTTEFPRKLSETGLFASTERHEPAAGLIPYSVNAELWSDHAHKERFLALPGKSQIEFETVTYPQPAPGAPAGWRFPDGTVVVKTFSLELERGNPSSRRRLETRILHFEQLAGDESIGDQVWRGYTYVWNDEQTDAVLLDKQGLDRVFTIRDPEAPGGVRRQTWHFPSRAECTLCHTMPAKYVLGVNTLQMNRDHDYGAVVANQLHTLEQIGVFTEPLPKPPAELPRLVDYRDSKQPLDARARSYLHANCAHCHMKWGGGNADFQLLATLELTETGTVGVRPGHGAFDVEDAQILAPGRPEQSMVLHRLAKLGLGRMPHVATSVVDEQGVTLIAEWIRSLEK